VYDIRRIGMGATSGRRGAHPHDGCRCARPILVSYGL